jgi:hypothetical protein
MAISQMSIQQTEGFYCYILVILFYIYTLTKVNKMIKIEEKTKILGRTSLDVYELYLP